MIFSLSEMKKDFIFQSREKVDVFCFFSSQHSVSCPPELWFESICTSLRMKHEVLVLEAGVSDYPAWDSSKRWVTDEHWIWLAPRSLSTLLEANGALTMTYPLLKTFLKNSK